MTRLRRPIQADSPRGRAVAIAAALLAIAACSKPPDAPQPASTPAPATAEAAGPSGESPSATPAAPAAALLARCRAASAYSLEHDGDFLLVMVDGRVVFEEGRAPFTSETPHLLASGTKSFAGVAAALAVQDGFLDLDERVSGTIVEWKDDPAKEPVTVRQLLSLASGLESLGDAIDSERNAAARGITDRAQASIAARSLSAAGERFIYGPSSFYVFGELMKRKLATRPEGDADIVAYLDRRLFTPLGIDPRVARDRVGNPNMAGGARVTAEDWAIFGEFIRNEGRHDGRQLADPAVLAELFRPHGPNPRYGLTWWLLHAGDQGEPEDALGPAIVAERLEAGAERGGLGQRIRERAAAAARAAESRAADAAHSAAKGPIVGYMAAGKGKQRLLVLPSERMVVVRFGDIDGGRRWDNTEFLELLVPVASRR